MEAEAKLLGRYGAVELRERLCEAGVLAALEAKGFSGFEVAIDTRTHALPSAFVFARSGGERHLLLEASVGEMSIGADFFAERGFPVHRPLTFVLVYWVREEDPTRRSSPARPLLPLQRHPGLGVLRRAFRVVTSMAADLGKDGVASIPKFFHDAALFFHSRLFLFLDGAEQGRFEALLRDLAALPLGDASLAVAAGCVRSRGGEAALWSPGPQAFPLSEALAAYFHSPTYAAAVARGLEESVFACEVDGLARAREMLSASMPEG
ncbi:MAG TPA: hypothetical protein VLF14_04085 [Candidatus Binatia bacterium]|nr:hypothetical protein [Candidatus Binatia bacterium]